MKKSEPKDYGYEDGGIEHPSGWSIEGGEEAYYDALKVYNNDVTEKPNEDEMIQMNNAYDEAKRLHTTEIRKKAFDFFEGDNYTQGFPDDYDGCVYMVAEFAEFLTTNLYNELAEVRENFKRHTIGCEHWKGSKILLIENLKKEVEVLTQKVNEINDIVDNPDFDMRSNEYRIWEIINGIPE